MSDLRHIQWLKKEIPKLTEEGVLSQEAADKLFKRYDTQNLSKSPSTALVITGILGAVLVGVGIISIFAYNWDSFPRWLRTIFSLGPLMVAQGFYGYAYFKRRDNIAWMESTSGFLMLMLASSIGLINQTYHIGGTISTFVLIWMLLSVPLLYLWPSILVGLLYLSGIALWAVSDLDFAGQSVAYWGLLALAVPFLYENLKDYHVNTRRIILGWATTISVVIGSLGSAEWNVPEQLIMSYAVLFPLLYLLGKRVFDNGATIWQRPFQSAGLLGIYIMSAILAYYWDVDNVPWFTDRYMFWPTLIRRGAFAIMVLGIIWHVYDAYRDKVWINPFVWAYPLLVFAGIMIGRLDIEWLSMLLMNIYLFAFGVLYMTAGIRRQDLSLLNAAMLFISTLIIIRFFDSDVSFIIKGVAFLLIGLGFLFVNFRISRKQKSHVQQTEG